MLRIVSAALQGTARTLSSLPSKTSSCRISSIFPKSNEPGLGLQTRYASFLCSNSSNRKSAECSSYGTLFRLPTTPNLLTPKIPIAQVPVRTVIKFSRQSGKRKTVKAVIKRFYRLDWGMWIRPKAGRWKSMWRKTIQRKRRLRRHVFTTPAQSYMLDKMVTKFWRRPKYYIDDPYEPYNKRDNFAITRMKPAP